MAEDQLEQETLGWLGELVGYRHLYPAASPAAAHHESASPAHDNNGVLKGLGRVVHAEKTDSLRSLIAAA